MEVLSVSVDMWSILYDVFVLSAPRHLVGNLPPYTNVSLKMILTNPEGRKESDETVIQTDEDGATCKTLFLIYFKSRFVLFAIKLLQQGT